MRRKKKRRIRLLASLVAVPRPSVHKKIRYINTWHSGKQNISPRFGCIKVARFVKEPVCKSRGYVLGVAAPMGGGGGSVSGPVKWVAGQAADNIAVHIG